MILVLELLGIWILAGVAVVLTWNAAKAIVRCRT